MRTRATEVKRLEEQVRSLKEQVAASVCECPLNLEDWERCGSGWIRCNAGVRAMQARLKSKP